MRYRLSRDAKKDLDGIFHYWAKRAGLEVADRLVDSIADRFWLLGEHPDAGKPSEEMAAGVKCFPAGKYLIYYRKSRRGTDILHVFHGAQDQKRAFRAKVKRLSKDTSSAPMVEEPRLTLLRRGRPDVSVSSGRDWLPQSLSPLMSRKRVSA